jgi:hypothetical protein
MKPGFARRHVWRRPARAGAGGAEALSLLLLYANGTSLTLSVIIE